MKKKLVLLATAFCAIGVLGGCGGDNGNKAGNLSYDRYAKITNRDVDSWLQIDPDDEEVSIDWWVDATSWDFYHLKDLIKKRTGVNVNFMHALTNDGTELSTMISGKMKDVITITDYSTRVQLAEQGYVYSIDRLADSYAPTLLKRISPEQSSFYSGSDNHLYGLANNFYNDADIAAYEGTGNAILPNNAIVVRKDMLKAYLDHMKQENGSFDADATVTTAQGFIDMCKWVKSAYNLQNDNPTVCLSEFLTKSSNGSISSALSALMEYFCVPKENANGDLIDEYSTPEFKEVVKFLNSLYNEHLFISGNFSYNASNIITNIKNGRPFAVIGAIQNYSTGFAGYSAAGYNSSTKTFDDSHEYVPIVVTNSKHQAPLLGNLAGRGLRVSMITKDCKREDRVIKVFDYLMSEQGQRECYYGEREGEYYNFVSKPGEIKDENGKAVYPYGQIEWTDNAKALLGAPQGQAWYNAGIKQISLLQNPLYVSLTSVHGAEMDTYQFYTRYNQKCALIPYSYDKMAFKYNLDTSNKRQYNNMVNAKADIEETWIKALPNLIMRSPSSVDALLEQTIQKTKGFGLDELIEFENQAFKAQKSKMGVSFAFPLNDPSYKAPEVKLQGFYDQYAKEIPDYIAIKE